MKFDCSLQSRGKLLLARAAGENVNPSLDVLEQAENMRIKLVRSMEMLQFFKDHNVLDIPAETEEDKKSMNAVLLDPPYIKVDFEDCRFKPFWRVFQQWPELNLDSNNGGSPFAPSVRPLEENKGATNQVKNDQAKKRNEILQRQRRQAQLARKKSTQYCEICNLDYEDIFEVSPNLNFKRAN